MNYLKSYTDAPTSLSGTTADRGSGYLVIYLENDDDDDDDIAPYTHSQTALHGINF